MFIQKLGSAIAAGASKIKLPKSLALAKDTVEIAKAEFTPFEKKLMEEVRQYSLEHGVETARVLDKKGDLLDLELIELPNNVTAIGKRQFELLNYMGIIGRFIKRTINYDFVGRKGTYIHSHTSNVPLSGTDVIQMTGRKMKKIIATTPDGSFSSLEQTKYPKAKNYLDAAKKIATAQCEKAKELGLKFNNTNPEKMSEYSSFSIKLLQDFADKFGFKFEHNFN